MNVTEKITIFLRAADLVSGKYRQDLNAATILGQGLYKILVHFGLLSLVIEVLKFGHSYYYCLKNLTFFPFKSYSFFFKKSF
jgi:hypothetical protein